MFSGAWMRGLSFLLIYLLLYTFLRHYSMKIARPITSAASNLKFTSDEAMDRGMAAFVSILGVGIGTVLCSAFVPFLQDYTMIIVALMFLVAGITSALLCKMGPSELIRAFFNGVAGILPAVAMILMASSIKYTLEEAQIMDTILHGAVGLAESLPAWSVVLFIYLIVLIMNFFIPSGSAKAFMLIPLIVPMAQIFGISPQLCVVAFAFGDGFSNVFYPTNPALLISLGLADIDYGSWFKWSGKFQTMNLILTCLILLVGFQIGY